MTHYNILNNFFCDQTWKINNYADDKELIKTNSVNDCQQNKALCILGNIKEDIEVLILFWFEILGVEYVLLV